MGNNLFKVTTGILALAVVGIAIWATQKIGGLEQRLAAATTPKDGLKLTECERNVRDLKEEIAQLKEQLKKLAATPPVADGGVTLTLEEQQVDGSTKTVQTTITGPYKPLDQVEITKVAQANRPSIQACYERALKRNQDLHVTTLRLNLAFAIHPTGSVGHISIAPAVDSGFSECIQKTVSRWRFPKFNAPSMPVTIPYRLQPRNN
jgi:hypothetical protein